MENPHTSEEICPYCNLEGKKQEHGIIPPTYRNKTTAILQYLDQNQGIGHYAIEEYMHTWYEDHKTCLNLLKTADKTDSKNQLTQKQINYLLKRLSEEDLDHARDQRNPFSYALQLILAWIEEDWIKDELQKSGHQVKLNGKDSDRKFLSQPSGEPDLILENGRKIEILHSFTGAWENGKVDLRDNKLDKLAPKDYLLGIEYELDYIFVAQKKTITTLEEIESHNPYGGKPATKIQIPKNAFEEGEKLLKGGKAKAGRGL